ncbi:MAG TPA: trypsin-like serine protease [Mycobacteriales bacterium]|jgi:glutamyl endopeptidase|nr:trypsin-like serine protease [Mycobacteriales bacterium]
MNLNSTARRLALGAAAATALTGAVTAFPATASAAALAPDALVSSTGRVLQPADLARAVPEASRRGVSGSVGTAPQPAEAESILGADDRKRVFKTRTYPARATVLINRDGRLHCTGWMVSPDTLVTAGHCVHTGGSNGSWYSGLTYTPGSNGGTAPFGTCRPARTFAFSAWVNNADWNFDGAIVKLDCRVGNTVGWYGMFWQTASLDWQQSIVRGYPGDKPSTQWRSTDVIRASETEKLYYQNDTVGGMSGSPHHQVRPSGSPFCVGVCSMGIHAYGVGGSGHAATNNSSTRLTEGKFNAIVGIINLP